MSDEGPPKNDTPPNNKQPIKPSTINPFLAARRAVGVRVSVVPRYVQDLAPGWSEQKASNLLDRHSELIATAMLAVAGQIILGLIQEKEQDELN